MQDANTHHTGTPPSQGGHPPQHRAPHGGGHGHSGAHGTHSEAEIHFSPPHGKWRLIVERLLLAVISAILGVIVFMMLRKIGVPGFESFLLALIPGLVIAAWAVQRFLNTVPAFQVKIAEDRLTGEVRMMERGLREMSLLDDPTETIDIEAANTTVVKAVLPIDKGGTVELNGPMLWRNDPDPEQIATRAGIKTQEAIEQTIRSRIVEFTGALVAPLQPFAVDSGSGAEENPGGTTAAEARDIKIDPKKSVFANLLAIRIKVTQEFAMDPRNLNRGTNGKSQLEKTLGIKILSWSPNITETEELAKIRLENLKVALTGERTVEMANNFAKIGDINAAKLANMTALGQAATMDREENLIEIRGVDGDLGKLAALSEIIGRTADRITGGKGGGGQKQQPKKDKQ